MKRNIIIILLTLLIILYAYLSNKYFDKKKDFWEIELSNYELSPTISRQLSNNIQKRLYPKTDSISIKFYQMRGNPNEKYITGYLKVNENYLNNDSLFNINYTHPFLDAISMTVKSGHFVTDVKLHYVEPNQKIDKDLRMDFQFQK